jgi:hypothetical protein
MPFPEKKQSDGEKKFEHKIPQFGEKKKEKPSQLFGGKKKDGKLDNFLELVGKGVGGRGGQVAYWRENGTPVYYSKLRDEAKSRQTHQQHRYSYEKLREQAHKMHEQGKHDQVGQLREVANFHYGKLPKEARVGVKELTPFTAKPRIERSLTSAAADLLKACKGCKNLACAEVEEKEDQTEKALTSRSLVVPAHMRSPAYDPSGTFRSATQQARMYTDLAPDVRATLANAWILEDPRAHSALEELKRSQEIQNLRLSLIDAVKPRGEVKFDKQYMG